MPSSLLSRRPPLSIVVLLLLLLLLQVMLVAAHRCCNCYRPVSVALALVPTSATTSTTRTSSRRSAPVMSTKGAAFKTLAAPTEYEEVRGRREEKWRGGDVSQMNVLSAFHLSSRGLVRPPSHQSWSSSPSASRFLLLSLLSSLPSSLASPPGH